MSGLFGKALILMALAAASGGAAAGFVGGLRQSIRALRFAQRAAYVFFGTLLVANLVLLNGLLAHDFSISFVGRVGSRAVPEWVTAVSLWSAHEGSMLFWTGILGALVGLFAYVYRDQHRELMAYAIAVMMSIGAFYTLLLSAAADPFAAVTPVPVGGPGPSPLLQDNVLMAVHPPAVYVGLVGLTVPFALAMAVVLRGKLDFAALALLRRWTLVAWLFLSAGIVLGAIWAYQVLGWGGFWSWDPIENAALLPWLTTTALLHTIAIYERRGVLKLWTLSLAVVAFLLALLGGFMARSGIFNSVHAFATSSLGPVLLSFVAITAVLSLGAIAGRAGMLRNEGRGPAPLSREAGFLFNNLLLLTFAFTVFVGTVYPLVIEALRGVKLSVGEPYFDEMAAPFAVGLLLFLGIGPALPWGRGSLRAFWIRVLPAAALGVLFAALLFALDCREPLPLLVFSLCAYATAATVRELVEPIIRRVHRHGESLTHAVQVAVQSAPRRFGGYVVHLGIIAIIAGLVAAQAYKLSAEVSLERNQTVVVGDYSLAFVGMRRVDEPHRMSIVAQIQVSRGGHRVAQLEPTLNYYTASRQPLGVPGSKTVGIYDLYVTLSSFARDGSRVTLRFHLNPLVSLLWWALPIIVLGALLCLLPQRRMHLAAMPQGALRERAP